MLWFVQSSASALSCICHGRFDPASILRYLSITMYWWIYWVWCEGGGHHTKCLSIFTDQWTTRVSLEVFTHLCHCFYNTEYMSQLFVHVMLYKCLYLSRSCISFRAVEVFNSTHLIVKERYIDFHELGRQINCAFAGPSPARDYTWFW